MGSSCIKTVLQTGKNFTGYSISMRGSICPKSCLCIFRLFLTVCYAGFQVKNLFPEMKQQKFLNQARHNEDFHNSLCREFEHSFFDWKITCLFYISIHYLKALAVKRNKYIGSHHA